MSSWSQNATLPVLPNEILSQPQPEPSKKIAGEADIAAWTESQAFHRLTLFIARLASVMSGCSLTDSVPTHPVWDAAP